MAVSKYYVGDVGTEIIVDTTVSLAAATVFQLRVLKPGASSPTTWAGTLYQGTKIRYVVQDGDFSVAGAYLLQAYVEMPGWSGLGNTANFIVYNQFG
jgi:hypothetical protein